MADPESGRWQQIGRCSRQSGKGAAVCAGQFFHRQWVYFFDKEIPFCFIKDKEAGVSSLSTPPRQGPWGGVMQTAQQTLPHECCLFVLWGAVLRGRRNWGARDLIFQKCSWRCSCITWTKRVVMRRATCTTSSPCPDPSARAQMAISLSSPCEGKRAGIRARILSILGAVDKGMSGGAGCLDSCAFDALRLCCERRGGCLLRKRMAFDLGRGERGRRWRFQWESWKECAPGRCG